MSVSGPEAITNGALVPSPEAEVESKISLADVDSVLDPFTETPMLVNSIHVVMKDGVMQVQVKPSGLAHYSLRAVLRGGQEALLYPMRTPDGETVGLTPIQSPSD